MSRIANPRAEPISNEFIERVVARLAQDKSVRRSLPLDGRLHIDRCLPFLIVYRQPERKADNGTRRLVLGEASYLVVSDDRQLRPGLSALIQAIAGLSGERYGAFLILEVWAGADMPHEVGDGPALSNPAFQIFTSKARIPTSTVEALERTLARTTVLRQGATVEVTYGSRRSPRNLPPILAAKPAREINTFLLGLEIKPIYRDPANGELYPLVLRALHRGLARCIKRTWFAFSRAQTTYRPTNHQVLGRRAVVKVVWDVDRRLAEISNAFDFLLQVTPINVEEAWIDFKRGRFQREPVFYYRPLPVDPAAVKGRLFRIPIGRIEDPTLAALFRQQQAEIDRRLTMLGDRGDRRFLYGSLQLYGGVTDELRRTAETLLAHIPPRSRAGGSDAALNADEFAACALREIEHYRGIYPALTAKVSIRNDIAGLMVSKGDLLISSRLRIKGSRVEALLQHEIGTHVLTYANGHAQPFQQLYTGLAGYEELQEGLAVLAEYLVGGLSAQRLRLLAGRVVAAQTVIDTGSFVDCYRLLNKTYGFKQKTAFSLTTRIYRGGGLTKDAIYLRGLMAILNYVQQNGDLTPLYVGKIAADHMPIIEELQFRKILVQPPLRPRYLDNPDAQARLTAMKDHSSVIDLLQS